MDFKIKLDFCIIPSPYNNRLHMLFITYKGLDRIDEALHTDKEYMRIKLLLSGFGYQEIDMCVFESSNNTSFDIKEIKYRISEIGIKYSKILEKNIIRELDSFHSDVLYNQGIKNVYSTDTNIYFSTTSPEILNQTKSKIPKVGEKITLYFYLFLQCHFVNESDCILELVGDLYSKDNNNTRNYLQITKSDFIRLDSNIPNVIMLQSTKNYGDFMNELNFLHKGNFKFIKPIMSSSGDMIMKTKEFVYNIMEIKKSINIVHRIVVEANINQYYDDMIAESKKIKKQLSSEHKGVISLSNIRPDMLLLKQKLKDKMLTLAEKDEFEKAGLVKNDISFVDNKINIVDSLDEKNISLEEYLKTFCLNS